MVVNLKTSTSNNAVKLFYKNFFLIAVLFLFPALVHAELWTQCAGEGQRCAFTGTAQIRYGANGTYALGSFTNGADCTNQVFGDPIYGFVKSCEFSSNIANQPVTPPNTWITCSNEGETCAFSGTATVRYGVDSRYYEGVFTDTVGCSNAIFGDPAFGTRKSCQYNLNAATPTPAPTPTPIPDPALGSNLIPMVVATANENAPKIFNASRSARGGDIVFLQGANLSGAKIYLQGLTAASDQALTVVNSASSVSEVSVQIPNDVHGAVVLRANNSSGTSGSIRLNAAIGYHFDANQITAGGRLRLFGRNLRLSDMSAFVTIDGQAAVVDLANSDESMLSVTAPPGLTPKAKVLITVDNGNGSGPSTLDRTLAVVAGYGDPMNLGVGWAAGFSAFSTNVVNASVACNGSTDDSGAIQIAIDRVANQNGGVVRLPTGICRLANGINLRSNVVLKGAGMNETTLRYESNYAIWAENLNLFGVQDLTVLNSGPVQEAPSMQKNQGMFLLRVRFDTGTSRQMYMSNNSNVVIDGCEFVQRGTINDQNPYIFSDSANMVFSNNTTWFMGGAPDFSRSHDSVLMGNRFIRDAANQNAVHIITTHSLVIGFTHRLAVIKNTFQVSNGPITNTTRNDGETILTEGGAGSRTENMGSVTSASSSTLYDSNSQINVDPFSTGQIPENFGVAIVAGKGAGQTRRVVNYSNRNITIDQPWDLVPDGSSRYATFVWGLEKSLIKANILSQNPRGIWLYHTAVRDVDIVENNISEGGGIYARTYQNISQHLFMPQFNVRIAKNVIRNTTHQWMSYINIVFVNSDALAFGISNVGFEVRENQITANSPNVNSGWEEYAGSEGFTNMMRFENYGTYQAQNRLIGTVFQGNSCTNCEVAFRLGTGADGTVITNNLLINSPVLWQDWRTGAGADTAVNSVVIPK